MMSFGDWFPLSILIFVLISSLSFLPPFLSSSLSFFVIEQRPQQGSKSCEIGRNFVLYDNLSIETYVLPGLPFDPSG